MRYLSIPGIDKPISRIALGSVSFTPETYVRAAELLDAFVAAGGTCVDTAHVYGRGASDRTLGMWIAERGNRDQHRKQHLSGKAYSVFHRKPPVKMGRRNP